MSFNSSSVSMLQVPLSTSMLRPNSVVGGVSRRPSRPEFSTRRRPLNSKLGALVGDCCWKKNFAPLTHGFHFCGLLWWATPSSAQTVMIHYPPPTPPFKVGMTARQGSTIVSTSIRVVLMLGSAVCPPALDNVNCGGAGRSHFIMHERDAPMPPCMWWCKVVSTNR